MDVIAAYRDVGSYRGAAQICGTTHKTVKQIIEAQEAGQAAGRKSRGPEFRPGQGFDADEKAATTFGLLVECFEQLGGVPKTVLADRMGCLKAGWWRMSWCRHRTMSALPPITGSVPISATPLTGVQGHGGASGRLCQTGSDGAAAAV
jgi:hypothetical protein